MGCSGYRAAPRRVDGGAHDADRRQELTVPEMLKIALIAIVAVIVAKMIFPKVPGLSAVAAHL